MAPEEILEAQAEVEAKLKPQTIAFLKERGRRKQKLPEENSPAVRCLLERVRFDLEGEVVGIVSEKELQGCPSDARRALERDPLRQAEGSVPQSGVYTVKEAWMLVQSAVQGQRMAGLQLLSRTLRRSSPPLLAATVAPHLLVFPASQGKDLPVISWREVWEFLLFELDLVSLVRNLCKDSSLVVRQRALELLSEICALSPEEAKLDEMKWRAPIAGCAVPFRLPLERSSPGHPWKKSSASTQSLREKLMHEVESEMMKDIGPLIRPESLSTVLRILIGLCQRGTEIAQLLTRDRKLLTQLTAVAEESSDAGERCLFVQCACAWIEAYPNALPTLISHRSLSFLCVACGFELPVGWTEVLLCGVGSWMDSPLTAESSEKELRLMKWFFRFWRMEYLHRHQFLSMEDLFPVYFPLLSTVSERREVREVASEVFLCFSATEEESLRLPNDTPCITHSEASSISMQKSAFEWLQMTVEGEEVERSCLAAALFFLSYRQERISGTWSDAEETSLLYFLSQVSDQELLTEWTPAPLPADRPLQSATYALLTSLLRFLQSSALRASLNLGLRLINGTREGAEIRWQGASFVRSMLERLSHMNPCHAEHPSQILELVDVSWMQFLSHFADFTNALLHVASETIPASFPVREALEFGFCAFTWMPPGNEAQALTCISSIFTSTTIPCILTSVHSTLKQHPAKSRPGVEEAEIDFLQEPCTVCNLLVEGFAATWCDIMPEDRLKDQESETAPTVCKPNRYPSPYSFQLPLTHTALGSHFPLPCDFLFRPWSRTTASWKEMHGAHPKEDAANLRSQLMLLVYLETKPDNFLSFLEAGEKLRRLIQLVFLQASPDACSDSFVHHCVDFLTETYLTSATQDDSFRTWTADFLEKLLDAYIASGDSTLSCVVALLFRNSMPLLLKLTVWETLEQNRLLHTVPDPRLWFGQVTDYLTPAPAVLCDRLEASLESGALKKAEKMESGAFSWAMHTLQASTNRTSQY